MVTGEVVTGEVLRRTFFFITPGGNARKFKRKKETKLA